jgi:hypothetical protein
MRVVSFSFHFSLVILSFTTGFGFVLVGNGPVVIQSIDEGGPAEVPDKMSCLLK